MITKLTGLVTSFFLIGLGAFGGGLVTIPLIQRELVFNRNWLSFEEMGGLLAVAQMTPGPIAVNAATFVGFHVAGIPGALIATCCVLLPAILILIVLTPHIDRISGNTHVIRLRYGIQLGAVSLIFYAIWSYGIAVTSGWRDITIMAAAFAVLVSTEGKMHPVVVILICGIAGIFIF